MPPFTLRATKLFFTICTVFFLSAGAHADGDANAGRVVAEQECTRCHNIEPAGPFKLHPPSFASIAVYRSEDQIYGRIAFPPLHANMPRLGYVLTPKKLDDLVAYIISLEEK